MKKLRDSQVLHIDLNGVITLVWLISVFPTCITCIKISDKSFIRGTEKKTNFLSLVIVLK